MYFSSALQVFTIAFVALSRTRASQFADAKSSIDQATSFNRSQKQQYTKSELDVERSKNQDQAELAPSKATARKLEAYAHAWTQLGDDVDSAAIDGTSGVSVSISNNGQIVAVGTSFDAGGGAVSNHVRVYAKDESSDAWDQLGGDIDRQSATDQFVYSVSLSGDGTIVAVGSVGEISAGIWSATVRIYQYSASSDSWTQLGSDIDQAAIQNHFELAGSVVSDTTKFPVSLSDDGLTVAFASNLDIPATSYQGIIGFVCRYSNSVWGFIGQSLARGSADYWSLDLAGDGNSVALGVIMEGTSASVEIYEYSSSSWAMVGSSITGSASDWFGYSLSLAGNGKVFAVGAPFGYEEGVVSVYTHDPSFSSDWQQAGSDIIGERSGDESGYSVSLSWGGNILAVGSHYDGGSGSGNIRLHQYHETDWVRFGWGVDGAESENHSTESISLSKNGRFFVAGSLPNDGYSGDGFVSIYETDRYTKWELFNGFKIFKADNSTVGFGDDDTDIMLPIRVSTLFADGENVGVTFYDIQTCRTENLDYLFNATVNPTDELAFGEGFTNVNVSIAIVKDQIMDSSIWSWDGEDGTQGLMGFCVKVNLFVENTLGLGSSDYMTVGYLKIKYDLTVDMATGFSLTIEAEEAASNEDEQETQVTYDLNACQCEPASKECLTNPEEMVISQNSALDVCISPETDDIVISKITSLSLNQGDIGLYVIQNSVNSALTTVSGEISDVVLVSTVMISVFFINPSPVTVLGVAILNFADTNGRRQLSIFQNGFDEGSNGGVYRGLQEDVGDGQAEFSLMVSLSKVQVEEKDQEAVLIDAGPAEYLNLSRLNAVIAAAMVIVVSSAL